MASHKTTIYEHDKMQVLIQDLLRTVAFLYLGATTITSRATCNGSTWTIRSPKKNLIVVLEYNHEHSMLIDSNAPNNVVPIGAETEVDSCVPEISAPSDGQLKQFVTMSSELTFQPADGEYLHASWTPPHEMYANFKSDVSQHPANSQVASSVEHVTANSGSVNPLDVSDEFCENFANSRFQTPTLSSATSVLFAETGSKLKRETFADGKSVYRAAQVLQSLPSTVTPQLPHKVQGYLTPFDTSATDSQRSSCSGSKSILGTKILREEPLNGDDERLFLDRAHHRFIAKLNHDQIDVENYIVPCWIKQEEKVSTEQAGVSSCRLSQKGEFKEVVNANSSLSLMLDLEVSSIIDQQAIKQEVEDELTDGFGIFPDNLKKQLHQSDSVVKFHNDMLNRSCETNVEISSLCKSQTKQNPNKDVEFILPDQEQLGYAESADEAVNDDQVVGECADIDDGLEVVPKWKPCIAKIHVPESSLMHAKMHTGETTFPCFVCGKKFGKYVLLKKHERIHSGKKPHACSHCGKRFLSSSNCKAHERIHTGEKPYSCSHCGKKFSCSSRCNVHERIHTGEKRYTCLLCGKKFISSSDCKVHERTHTGEKPYACSHCGKKFNRSSLCNLHERIHTGEKPYECFHCGKKFVSSSDCKIHERIHTGEKPYTCSHCGKKFVSSSSCKVHERIHAGD